MKLSRFLAQSLCIWLGAALTAPTGAQSIKRDIVIEAMPPTGEPLEKVIDFFTSPAFPSVVIGNGRGGLYLYRSTTGKVRGPWTRSDIAPSGSAYERARAIRFPGDAHPGVVASIGNRIVWFENPLNQHPDADVTLPWPQHVINPDHGCHDIQLTDLDLDGRIDLVCSAGISLRAPQFVAFQDDRDHWQIVYDVADAGDAIAVVRIGTDPVRHLAGAARDGNIYWYENPRSKGGDARTANWTRHLVGPGNVGNSIAAGPVASLRDDIITAANEHEGPGGSTDERGITWYEQPADPDQPWIAHSVAPDYRDVHEITIGTWNGATPYLLVAEQEQACKPASPEGRPPTHPALPCRIALFQWQQGRWNGKILARASTQNQAVIAWQHGLMMADANHGVYGGSRAIHVRVIAP
jgi:hypothetical protein